MSPSVSDNVWLRTSENPNVPHDDDDDACDDDNDDGDNNNDDDDDDDDDSSSNNDDDDHDDDDHDDDDHDDDDDDDDDDGSNDDDDDDAHDDDDDDDDGDGDHDDDDDDSDDDDYDDDVDDDDDDEDDSCILRRAPPLLLGADPCMRPPVEKQNGSAIPWPRSLARNKWSRPFEAKMARGVSKAAQDGLQDSPRWPPLDSPGGGPLGALEPLAPPRNLFP